MRPIISKQANKGREGRKLQTKEYVLLGGNETYTPCREIMRSFQKPATLHKSQRRVFVALASSHCLCLANRASIFMCKPMSYAFYVKAMPAFQLPHIIICFIFLLYAQVCFIDILAFSYVQIHGHERKVHRNNENQYKPKISPDKCWTSCPLVWITVTTHLKLRA